MKKQYNTFYGGNLLRKSLHFLQSNHGSLNRKTFLLFQTESGVIWHVNNKNVYKTKKMWSLLVVDIFLLSSILWSK